MTNRRAGWVINGNAAIGDIIVTKAAEPKVQHQIRSITASYNKRASGLLLVLDGDTIIWSTYIHNSYDKDFTIALPNTVGNSLSVQLCSGGILTRSRLSVIGDSL